MPFSTGFAQEVLSLIFENDDIANLGDASGVQGSSVNGSVEVALLKTGGSEADYTGYQRQEITRNTANWNIISTTLSNANDIAFPTCTGNAQTIIGFKIFYGANGTTPYSTELGNGTLTSSVAIAVGETPQFEAGALTITLS